MPRLRSKGCGSAPHIHVPAVKTLPSSPAAIPPPKQLAAPNAPQANKEVFVSCCSTQRTYDPSHKDGVRGLLKVRKDVEMLNLDTGIEAVTDPGFSEDVARIGGICFDLLSKLANEHSQVL